MLASRVAPPLGGRFCVAWLAISFAIAGGVSAGSPPDKVAAPPTRARLADHRAPLPPEETPRRLPGPTTNAAAGAVVAEAHYTAKVEKRFARIACRYVVDVLAEGPVEVPFDFGETAVGILKDDQKTSYLRGIGKGRFALGLNGKGRHELRLELMAKVRAAETGTSFSFSCPPAAVTSLDVLVPRPDRDVVVSPPLIADDVKPADSGTRAKGRLTSTRRVTVLWREKPQPAAADKPVVTVRNATRLTIRPGSIVSATRLAYAVHRGRMTNLEIAVPAGGRVLDVVGPEGTIRDWKTTGPAEKPVLSVRLAQPVSDRIAVQVYAERKLAGESVPLSGIDESGTFHGIHALHAMRETGVVAISHDAGLRVTVPDIAGSVRIPCSEAPAWLTDSAKGPDRHSNAPQTQFLRWFRANAVLAATIDTVKPQLTVHQDSGFLFRKGSVKVTSVLFYRVADGAVDSTRIGLPGKLVVDRVISSSLKSFRVDASRPAPVLQVDFVRPLTGRIELTIDAHREAAVTTRPTDVDLPLLRPLDVSQNTGRIHVAAVPQVEVVPAAESPDGLTPEPVTGLSESSGRSRVAAWSYRRPPDKLTVQAGLRPARLSATVDSNVHLRQRGRTIRADVNYLVSGAPLSVFRFSVPAAAGKSLRITDAHGAELPFQIDNTANKESPEPKRSGESRPSARPDWIDVVLDSPQPVLGAFRVAVSYEVPQPSLSDKAVTQPLVVVFNPLRVLNSLGKPKPLTDVTGTITVTEDRGLRIVNCLPDASGNLRFNRQSAIRNPQSHPETTFHYRSQPAVLKLQVSRLEDKPLAEVLVSRALAEVVVAGDDAATYRCRYRIRTAERQRLRIDLPKTVEPLGAFVDGRRVDLEHDAAARTESDWQAFLIDASRRKGTSGGLSLVLQFRMPLTPPPFHSLLGRLRLHLPRIAGPNGTPAVVQELRTAVWIPRRFVLPGRPERFVRRTRTRLTGLGPGQFAAAEDTQELERWIGVAAPDALAYPRTGHAYRFDGAGEAQELEVAYADLGFAAWVLGIPLLIIGVLLARTSWQNRVGFVLLAALVALLAATRYPDVVYHGLLSARYGLAVVLLWWIAQGVLVGRRHAHRAAAAGQRSAPCPLPVNGLSAVVIPPPGTFDDDHQRHAA